MKEQYTSPDMEIIDMDLADILTASGDYELPIIPSEGNDWELPVVPGN